MNPMTENYWLIHVATMVIWPYNMEYYFQSLSFQLKTSPVDPDDIVPLTLIPWVFLLESILNPPESTNFVTHKMLVSWIHQNPPV